MRNIHMNVVFMAYTMVAGVHIYESGHILKKLSPVSPVSTYSHVCSAGGPMAGQ